MALVTHTLDAKQAHVGDFSVRRVLPQVAQRVVGPFCFLDHLGPHEVVGAEGGGVAPHPHIGLATVTWLFDGEVLHRDSLGTEERITPGDVNWMSAGRGIVHSERTPPSHVGRAYTLHGLQFWVALPMAAEEGEPSFQHAPRSTLPLLESGGASVRVVLGTWGAATSPVRVASPLTLAIFELEPGAHLELDPLHPERALYVVDGAVAVGTERVVAGQLAVLAPNERGAVTASGEGRARVAFLAGAPLDGARFLLWNFVSSRRERLLEARDAWVAGEFPSVPGDAGPRVEFPGVLLRAR
jgi:hypothetical protein